MMLLKRSIVAVSVATLFSGCVSVPAKQLADSSFKNEAKVQSFMEAEWTEQAVQRDGRPYMVLVTPMSPPKELKDKPISLALESGTTVRDIVAVLANLGYSIILGDSSVGDKEFYLPRYKGTLGGLMSAVSRTADVWFTWQDGVITVSGKERIMLSVPQDEGLASSLKDGLTGLGVTGEDSMVSFNAGMLSLEVRPAQFNKVKAFLQRMTSNAALVTLQVAVVTVNLTQSAKQGIDWSKMQLALGKQNKYILKNLSADGGVTAPTAPTSGVPTQPTTPTTTSTSATGTAATATASIPGATVTATTQTPDLSNTLLLGASGLRAVAANGIFSLVGFIDFLNDYGSTETKQNVMLKTVTGHEVVLKSVTQIPYVSGVNVNTTGSSVGNGAASLLGSTSTEKANDGLTLKMRPSYDAYSSTVTVKLDMSIQAVVGFNDLSAGNQVGQLSQPTTAERSFNDIIRVRPGQTVVVGGITYDSVADNRTGPAFLSGTKAEHKQLTINRQTMFIVVRPTITVFGAVAEHDSSDFSPEGTLTAVPAEGLDKPATKMVSKSPKTATKD